MSADDRVLEDLADIVASLARSSDERASVVEQLVDGHETYVAAARALLTRKAIPSSPNPGEGGELALDDAAAADALAALSRNLQDVAQGVADHAQAQADVLQAVNKKEQEHKQPGGPGGETPGGQTPGGQTGGGPSQPGGSERPGAPGPAASGGDTKEKAQPDPQTAPRPTPSPTDPVPGTVTGPTGTTTTGTTTTGTTTGPSGNTGGPSTVSKPGGGPSANPVVKKEPKDPPPPTPTPDPPVVKKVTRRRRRCYSFKLSNTGTDPISDLHFQGPAAASTTAPPGWFGGPSGDGTGFGFEARDMPPPAGPAPPLRPLPPGRTVGPFEFCVDDGPMQANIYISHPGPGGVAGGSFRKAGPGDVLVGGGAAPLDENGNPVIPASRRSWVHEVTLGVGATGGTVFVDPGTGGGKPTCDTPGVTRWSERGSRVIQFRGPDGGPLPANAEITVKIPSTDPHLEGGAAFTALAPGTTSAQVSLKHR